MRLSFLFCTVLVIGIHAEPLTRLAQKQKEWTDVLKQFTKVFIKDIPFDSPLGESSWGSASELPNRNNVNIRRGVTENNGTQVGDICSDVGLVTFNNQVQNLCSGLKCTILEMMHNNRTITKDNVKSFASVPLANTSEITKLTCDGFIIDLQETHNASQCYLQTLKCGTNQDVNSFQVTNSMLFNSNCLAQLECFSNHNFYGYQYYGYHCVNQQLYCDGSLVNVTEEGAVNISAKYATGQYSNCSVEELPCDLNAVSSSTCSSFEFVCEGSVNAGCIVEHKEVDSCGPSSSPTCSIRTVSYNGTQWDVQTPWNGDSEISGYRWYVEQLVCSNQTIGFSDYSNCTASCPQNDPRNCTLQQLRCELQTTSPSCHRIDFVCPGARNCSLDVRQFACAGNAECNGAVNVSSCSCPLDRQGAHCESYTPFKCTLENRYPSTDCNNPFYKDPNDDKQDLLSQDRPCLIFALKEAAELGYMLNCAFVEQPSSSTNFSYYIKTDKWALSLPPQTPWELTMKLFNFNRLSDNGGNTWLTLTTNQMKGEEMVWLNTSILSSIPERFWAGNRLYFETKVTGTIPMGLSTTLLKRGFLDSPDKRQQGTETSQTDSTIIVLSVVLSLVGVGIIAVVVKRYQKYIPFLNKRKSE